MKNYVLNFIKHGKTKGNDEGKYIGVTDEELSEKGAEEIRLLRQRLYYPEVDVVYTSPLKRCVETADIIYPDSFTKIEDNIKEYDFGVFENKTMDELKELPEFKKWAENGMTQAPPGGENKKDFDQRISQGLENIIRDMMNSGVYSAAVVTHGGVIMNLLSMFGLPKENPFFWTAQPGCGFSVSTSAYLWGSGHTFEITGRIPFDPSVQTYQEEYAFFDIEDKESD